MSDKEYMLRAIELAKNGIGWANPNPMVGAVIVKDGKIIGEGYHKKCGEFHAERSAFAGLKESAEGATIYVTLEPCCHYGKQPPCTEAIIENKIKRVVIGSRDPNPLVSGKGAKLLREKGIIVEEDFLREECDKINPVFFHYITTKKPYVVMKYAMTMDGKIATKTGASKWITGEKAREYVQGQRRQYAAIMAGIGTVLADDPMLNVRIPDEDIKKEFINHNIKNDTLDYLPAHQPVRIVIDSKLRIPTDSKIVKTASEYKTIVFYNKNEAEKYLADEFNKKKAELEKSEVILLDCPDENGQVNLAGVIDYLGEEKIDSVYIEGGGQLHEAAMKAGIVNHVSAYIAPKIFGGKDAKTPVEGSGISEVCEAMKLHITDTKLLGEDILIEADVE